MDFEKKNVRVVGMARSGVAAAQLLRASGAVVTVNDSKTEEELGQQLSPLEGLQVERRFGCGAMELLEGKDCLVISPGIPDTAPFVVKAKEMGINYKVGKFMFTASGKATAAGKTDGFVKLISDADTDKLLGVHLIGADVTEIIGGMVLAMDLGATATQVRNTVFPHPTMSEAIRDAAEVL